MGKYEKDIRAWRATVAKNRARALALFNRRHASDNQRLTEVRTEISLLHAQSNRLMQFIRDFRRRDAQ